MDRVLCPSEFLVAAQSGVSLSLYTNKKHQRSGHLQLTAHFRLRPSVRSDEKDPIHQTIPSDIFCPGRTEANPYDMPNDLQELLRRFHRRSTDEVTDYVATIWSWWRMQPSPSCHHRIEKHNLPRKYLHVQAEQVCVPRDHPLALQKKSHHVYGSQVLGRGNPAKLEVRRDTLVMMFTLADQVHMSRQYGSVEELNQKARGLGSSIGFSNRLCSICP